MLAQLISHQDPICKHHAEFVETDLLVQISHIFNFRMTMNIHKCKKARVVFRLLVYIAFILYVVFSEFPIIFSSGK